MRGDRSVQVRFDLTVGGRLQGLAWLPGLGLKVPWAALLVGKLNQVGSPFWWTKRISSKLSIDLPGSKLSPLLKFLVCEDLGTAVESEGQVT